MKVSDSEGPWKRCSDSDSESALQVALAPLPRFLAGSSDGGRSVTQRRSLVKFEKVKARHLPFTLGLSFTLFGCAHGGAPKLLPPGVIQAGPGRRRRLPVAFAHGPGEAASTEPSPTRGQHDAARMHDDDHTEHPPGGAHFHSAST